MSASSRQKPLPGLGRLPRAQDSEEFVLEMEQAEGESELEKRLLAQLRQAGVVDPQPQFHFDSRRGWRFDYAWPALRLAVEVEGGVFTEGRHNRPIGFIRDTHKYNAAAIQGWCLLRYTLVEIRSGKAAEEIALVIQARKGRVE